MKTFGMPYKGSKNSIAIDIIKLLPDAEYFVDLFGGGGSMVHCATESGKYEKFIYNELEPLVYNGFVDSINGKFKNETRWISRDDFNRLKDTDFYVASCFSFGNAFNTYLYSREIEPWKHALHDLKVLNDFSLMNEIGIKFEWLNDINRYYTDIKNTYLKYLSTIIDSSCRFVGIKHTLELENMERLKRLENMEESKKFNISTFNLDYRCVEIPDNSIIYCDIPYSNTSGYCTQFNHSEFYDWCRNSKHTIFISEYTMPDDFYCISEFTKNCTFSSTSNNLKTIEKLYCNKPFKVYNKHNSLF